MLQQKRCYYCKQAQFITQQQQLTMSFVQLISKNTNKRAQNPAFQQLNNRKPLSRLTYIKSQPGEASNNQANFNQNQKINFLKSRATSLGYHSRKGTQLSYNNSPSRLLISPEKVKVYKEKNLTQNSGNSKKAGPQTTRVQYHHSFSNYLARKNIGFSQITFQGKILYYDLNEIVNKISSPVKLTQKIEDQEQKIKLRQKKSINLSQYQYFLKEVDDEKNRYHEGNSQNKEYLSSEDGSFFNNVMKNRERVRPKTLWLRSYSRREGKQENGIEPWLQNEEQHSPINLRNNKSLKKYPKIIQQDLQGFIQ